MVVVVVVVVGRQGGGKGLFIKRRSGGDCERTTKLLGGACDAKPQQQPHQSLPSVNVYHSLYLVSKRHVTVFQSSSSPPPPLRELLGGKTSSY